MKKTFDGRTIDRANDFDHSSVRWVYVAQAKDYLARFIPVDLFIEVLLNGANVGEQDIIKATTKTTGGPCLMTIRMM